MMNCSLKFPRRQESTRKLMGLLKQKDGVCVLVIPLSVLRGELKVGGPWIDVFS